MGFVRGLGKFFGSTIFTTFLVLVILMSELISLSGYENFKLIIGSVIEKQFFSKINEEDLGAFHSMLIYQCAQTDKVSLPFFGSLPVVLNCADVMNSDKSQLPTLVVGAVTESFYYREFDCGFIDCIKRAFVQGGSTNFEDMLIVVSNDGNQFYRSLQTYMWVGAGVGLILLLVSTATWAGRLKGVGWNLVFTGLPFVVLSYFQSKFIPQLPAEVESTIKPVIESIFSSLKGKFVTVLVIGIVLVVAGYALGFYLSRKMRKKSH